MLAMDVNDNAGNLTPRSALKSIASSHRRKRFEASDPYFSALSASVMSSVCAAQ